MEIKKATINNLDSLAGLFDRYRIFYRKESDIEGSRAFISERLTNNDAQIFLAFDKDVVVGFMQLYPLFSSTRMKKFWLLNDLFVNEDFRGRGFSVALIDEAKQFCVQSGACGFMLETEKTNTIGNRLYRKMNLQLDAEHNYYTWDA